MLFNVIEGRDSDVYVAGIRAAFGAAEVFRPPSSGNAITVTANKPRINRVRSTPASARLEILFQALGNAYRGAGHEVGDLAIVTGHV